MIVVAVKFKYIGSCLNAFAKLQNARGSSLYPVLMRNFPKFSIGLGLINPLNGVLSVRSRWRTGHEIL